MGLNGEVVERLGFYAESVKPVNYLSDFINYYNRELVAGSWEEADSADSINGEWHSYSRQGKYFEIGLKKVANDEYLAVVMYD